MMRFVFAMALASLAGCSSGDGPDEQAANVQDHRDQFEAHGLASYSFTWTQGCFCDTQQTRATRVSVTGDTITRAVYVDDQTPTRNTDIKTIAGVFDLIDDAYARQFDEIDVTYDPAYGFPSAIYFDPVKQASDEETQIGLTAFATPADTEGAP